MTRKDADDRPNHGVNRRNILKYAATGTGLAVSPLSLNATAKRGSDVRIRKGTKEQPLTNDDLLETRKAAVDEYVDRGGELRQRRFVGVPENINGDVVAYVCKITPRGIPIQYGGIVGEKSSAEHIHERAEIRADTFAKNDVDGLETTNASGTQDVTTESASWEWIDHGEWDFDDCPYGYVTNNWDLAWLNESQDSTQDAYAIDHYFELNPGTRSCSDSSWQNYRGWPKHDWADGSMGGEDMDEHDPQTDLSGSQTVGVSVGTGGAGLSWEYQMKDFTMKDKTSTPDNYGRWKQKIGPELGDKLVTTEPGSSCWVNEGSCDKLLEVEGWAKWLKRGFYENDYHWSKATWSMIDSC